MTNKLKYFIGNWKMFGDLASFKIVYRINQFARKFARYKKCNKVVLCLPNTLIHPFNKNLKFKYISLGAQNCHHYDGYGPYTGSVSASMIKKLGAEYIILGHSENRSEGETNELIKKKIQLSLKQKLNVIFCIGETLKEKRKGKTFSILKNQIQKSLDKKFNMNKIIFAYEPVWAIGTAKIPQMDDLRRNSQFIKKIYMQIFKTKKYPKLLYGGSVNHNNIHKFALISEIDGFLIGGASQSSKKFIDIIKNYYK